MRLVSISLVLLGAICAPAAHGAMDLLGISWTGGTYLIDSQTGQYRLLSNIPYCFNDLARSPDGRVFGIGYSYSGSSTAPFIEIDPRTGSYSVVGQVSGLPTVAHAQGAGSPDVTGLAFAPDGTLYATVYSYSTSILYQIDTSTFAASPLGDTHRRNVMALTFSPGGELYGNLISGGLIRIDTQNASAVNVNPYQSRDDLSSCYIQALAFLEDGTLLGVNDYYASRTQTLQTIGLTTGFGSAPRPASGLPDIRGLVLIPEPATMLLILAAAILPRRRGRQDRSS